MSNFRDVSIYFTAAPAKVGFNLTKLIALNARISDYMWNSIHNEIIKLKAS